MNHLSIRRDGKSIQLTAEEMLEAYRRVREDLIEQDLLLHFSDFGQSVRSPLPQ